MWFNMMYFGTGRELVTNVPLVHSARDSFRLFKEQVKMATNLLDFIERFGARVQPLLQDIDSLERLVDQARSRYISQEYGAAVDIMSEATESLHAISEMGVRLKAKALTWVYAIEWMAVTSVGLISGVALFSLMIRRRLYQEARATRFG
jgi:hypothetical protein